MQSATLSNEDTRIEALRSYEILDTPQEREYDDFAFWAAQICQTPIGLVSLVDSDRIWFKSAFGIDLKETQRVNTFCNQAIYGTTVFVVPNAIEDERFSCHECIKDEPFLRFYAGAPLIDSARNNLGTLCVLDYVPRKLSNEQISSLELLSRKVVSRLELRKALKNTTKVLQNFLPICSYCGKIKDAGDKWNQFELSSTEKTSAQLRSYICPTCYEEKLEKELEEFHKMIN